MRAYTIALWSLILNLALGVFTFMPLFGVALSGTVLWGGNVTNGTGTWEYVDNGTFNFTTTNGSMIIVPHDQNLSEAMNFSQYHVGGMTELNFFDAILRFADAVWRATAFAGWLMAQLGFHMMLVGLVTVSQYFVYAFGVIQFLTGRGGKTDD
jgi:hypothetical protein